MKNLYISHSSKFSLSNSDFKRLWHEAEYLIKQLNSTHIYLNKQLNLLHRPMDEALMQKYFVHCLESTKIEHLESEMKVVHASIIEGNENVMEAIQELKSSFEHHQRESMHTLEVKASKRKQPESTKFLNCPVTALLCICSRNVNNINKIENGKENGDRNTDHWTYKLPDTKPLDQFREYISSNHLGSNVSTPVSLQMDFTIFTMKDLSKQKALDYLVNDIFQKYTARVPLYRVDVYDMATGYVDHLEDAFFCGDCKLNCTTLDDFITHKNTKCFQPLSTETKRLSVDTNVNETESGVVKTNCKPHISVSLESGNLYSKSSDCIVNIDMGKTTSKCHYNERFQAFQRRQKNLSVLFNKALNDSDGNDVKAQMDPGTTRGKVVTPVIDNDSEKELSELFSLVDLVEAGDNAEMDSDSGEEKYINDVFSQSKEIKLREYQLELAEKALNGKNTVICADTGSGKTWVALHIVQEHLNSKGSVYIINKDERSTVPLNKLMEIYDVFFFTPQILINNIEKGDTRLPQFTLLILDECHHTAKGDPYNNLMRKYIKTKHINKEIPLPQIVGLTASIGVGADTAEEGAIQHMIKIFSNLDVHEISTVERNKEEMKKFVAIPTEGKGNLNSRQNLPGGDYLSKTYLGSIIKLKNQIMCDTTLPEDSGREMICCITHLGVDLIKTLKKQTNIRSNPNLSLIEEKLQELYSKSGKDSLGMIFVQTRATAKSLAEYLNDKLQGIEIPVKPFIGSKSSETSDGLSETEKKELLEDFRSHKIKLLVATSVGSEGIDVPECNIVMKYNYSGNEINIIQMRGRTRKAGGQAIYISDQSVLRRDLVSMEKAAVMHRALDELKQKGKEEIRKMILTEQKNDLQHQEEQERKLRELQNQKKRGFFKLVCATCKETEINGDNIKLYKQNHHVAAEREFLDRVKKEDIKEEKINQMIRKSIIYCKKCPQKLGKIFLIHDLEVPLLKIDAFLCKEGDKLRKYKNWKFVPYIIDEINHKDLEIIFPKLTTPKVS
ncbi:IFIH1 [Mytilus edulis]|uniref:IFIH1 n=1 Tax=Mytilus edulis TaxID=6550 RepID=A0A8S3TDJ7_MYTED|nr:IFIH1 [Mytilus edulis]